MAIAETAELVAELNLKGNFASAAKKAQTGLRGLTKEGSRFRDSLAKAQKGLISTGKTLAAVAAGGVAFLAYNVKQGIESLAELEDVTLATNQVLKTTKGVAGQTADSVRELAEEYEDLTTVDDKVIQGAENLLLTFTNIRKKAFEPTLAAALDMSEALDMDLNSAVRTLGKALQSPAEGLSRLTRLGVTFTEREKEKIEALQKSGRTMEAQQVILDKLNRLYGGRAAQAAQGYRGQLARVKDAVEELQMALGEALFPALARVSRKITTFLRAPKVKRQVRSIGRTLASLFEGEKIELTPGVFVKGPSPFDKLFTKVKEGFTAIQGLPWETIKGALSTTLEIGRKALEIFQGLPPEVQAGLVTLLAANKLTGGLVADLGRTAIDLALKALTTIVAGNVTVVGKTVTGPGGPGSTPTNPQPGGGPAVPTIGAGIFMDQGILTGVVRRGTVLAMAELNIQRNQAIAAAGIQTAQRWFGGAKPGTVLTPVSNDILDGIANSTTTISEDGKATRQQTAAEVRHGRLMSHQLLRAVPLIGGVKDRVSDLNNTVRRKDLSVAVSVVSTVSAVTNEDKAAVVRAQNRIVYN